MKKARSDFVELAFEDGKRPSDFELTRVVRKFWLPEEILPGRNTCSRANYHCGYNKVCRNCGSRKHSLEDCTESLSPCNYPHSISLDVHSILTCPELSQFCTKCATRGHFIEAHNFFTKRQLENNFLRHSHLGLFVCFPYFELVPSMKEKLMNYHWTFSLYKRFMPYASIIATRLSLPAVTRFGSYPSLENRHQYKIAEEKRQQFREELSKNKDEDEASEHGSDEE